MAPITASVAAQQNIPLTPSAWHAVGDLTNPIHPIFKQSNFDNGINYNIMRPSLRLASKFITTRPLPGIFHTFFFSGTKVVTDAICPRKRSYGNFEFTSTGEHVSEAMAREVYAAFANLTGKVHFRVVAEDPSESKPWEASCSCNADGSGATIELYRGAWTEMSKRALEHEDNGDDVPYLEASFEFAKTLVHEIAHAAIDATRTQGHYYLPGSAIAEDGYNWENHIFGGIIECFAPQAPKDGQPATKIPIVQRCRWPAASKVQDYVAQNHHVGVRLSHAEEFLPDAPFSKVDNHLFQHLDFGFVRRLFSEAFWRVDVANMGLSTLHAGDAPWRWAGCNSQMVKTLSKMYLQDKRALEDEAFERQDLRGLAELRKLCEPWEEFLDNRVPVP